MCPGGAAKKMDGPALSVPSLPSQYVNCTSATTATASFAPASPNPSRRCGRKYKDDETEACRFCGSSSIHVDWRAGDRVCTTCGAVADERIFDHRPEWREFNDAEDLVKGIPSAARCGTVPVDESRYFGGLQPTTLSTQPYGGQTGPSSASNRAAAREAMARKRLQSTNRKLNRMMGQRPTLAHDNAPVSRLLPKRQCITDGETTDHSDLDSVVTTEDYGHPEVKQILIQEEEDASRKQIVFNSDKWSLKQAILLFEHHESVESPGDLSEKDDLEKRLHSKLRNASSDLYEAYQMLVEASRRLQLPDRVVHEATDILCNYLSRRDGFAVKGIASRLTLKKENLSAWQQKQAADTLREHNKMKQMGSLCAALLCLTGRKLGWPRPLTDVCESVQPVSSNRSITNNNNFFIRPKHCYRAMDEIKRTLPDFERTIALAVANISTSAENTDSPVDDPVSTINFVDHSLRKLCLPPVAGASIRALAWHCAQEQKVSAQINGTKLSTLCASLAFFVCLSGSVMQQLASQAQAREWQRDSCNSESKFVFAKKNSMAPPPTKVPKLIHMNEETPFVSIDGGVINKANTRTTQYNYDEFDVFSRSVGKELLVEKKEYEMRRVWDAWTEQTAWLRSSSDIEQSSGVSSHTFLSHYKYNIYPRRQVLLETLRNAVTVNRLNPTTTYNPEREPSTLMETPLASVLLSNVVVVAPFLNLSGKRATFGTFK